MVSQRHDVKGFQLVVRVEKLFSPYLQGMFCRNGPNPILHRLSKRYHWFDGYAMLHNLRFEGGNKAWYTNQFVPDNRYVVEQEIDRSFFPTLGEYTGFWGLVKAIMHPDMVSQRVPDLLTVAAMNTACIMFNDKFYCLNESAVPLECRILPNGRRRRHVMLRNYIYVNQSPNAEGTVEVLIYTFFCFWRSSLLVRSS